MAAYDRVPADVWEQLAQVLDAGVDHLSGEQEALAIARASRRLGVASVDAQDEGHLRVLWDELRAVVLRASLDRLVARGQLAVAGVAADGRLIYERPGRGRSRQDAGRPST